MKTFCWNPKFQAIYSILFFGKIHQISKNTWRDSLSNDNLSNENSSNDKSSNDNLSNDSSSNRQFIEPTIHRTDSLSNDSLSNWQFIETRQINKQKVCENS